MKTAKTTRNMLTVVMVMAVIGLMAGAVQATVVTTGLSLHYRADDVDGLGNPGTGATTALVNLANPGTHDGTIVSGSGIIQNLPQAGTPYEYGVVLNDTSQTYIQANTYQIAGGTNKATSATWEYWLRADSGVTGNRGALYGEFAAGATNNTRHYLRLEGIGTGTRTALYDEFPPSGNSAMSDSQLFDTSAFTQVVVTKSGNTMTFYKDGAQVGSTKSHSETFSGSAVQTWFGGRNAQNESFDGQFNIIRVYDAVLTPAEVQGNYNAELGIAPPPPPADLKVDTGRSESPQLQSGWQEWNFTGASGIINQSGSFAYAGATDGTVEVNLSTTTSAQGRNYGIDQVTDPGNLTIPDVWRDQVFWNNNTSGSMTLTLDDLKAGDYTFTSYSYADNLSDSGGTNDEGTASASIEVDTGSGFVDTGLDVTFIAGLQSTVAGSSIEAADLDAYGTLSFGFTVANDGDPVKILYDNITGGDTFGINGFELTPPPPPGPVTPVAALADLNRTGPGNPGLVSGSVQATIDPWGFPGGDVDLGENPNDLDGSRLAYWYLKPASQGSGAYPPQSLYYDLGQAMTVDQIHLWWSDRDAPNTTGRVTDMDIDYLPMSATQPGTFDLGTMQGLGGWLNAVDAYDPSAGSFGVQQDLDPADFLTRYLRLTMNASGYGTSNGNQWGGLRQIAVTEAAATPIPEPITMTMTALALCGLGGYVKKRRRHTMKHVTTIAAGLALAVVLGTAPVAEAAYFDLTGDNVDINSDSSWVNVGGGGSRRAGIGRTTTGLTGYLDSTYTDSAGRPMKGDYWDVQDGHLDLRDGASLTVSRDLKLANPTDENAATVTLNPNTSFFEDTNTSNSYGLFIGYNNTRGTFTLNNGGTVGSRTDVALGGGVGGANGNTSNSVGVFQVIGDGGTIDCDVFRVSRYSKVVFELDDTGISTIDVGGQLQIWDDGGSPAGNLVVDTSALPGFHTVDLFEYGSLSGTFGTVEVTGSALTEGNGIDPGTYALRYGSGKVTLTYNNGTTAPVKIDPAELSATANTSSGTSPIAAVDGSGLNDVDDPSTHQDAGGYQAGHWRSGDYNHGGGTEADEWFVVDLGGERDLALMRLWSGFQDRSQTRNPTRRNLERFDLYYANTTADPGNPLDNPANWTLLLNDQPLHDPEDNNIGIGGDNNDLISILDAGLYNLAGTTATHLALFDLHNGGQDGWTGRHTAIAEIEVFQAVAAPIPEPATMAALGLAVAGLGGYVRKRRRA